MGLFPGCKIKHKYKHIRSQIPGVLAQYTFLGKNFYHNKMFLIKVFLDEIRKKKLGNLGFLEQ